MSRDESLYRSPNPHRLYRNVDDGVLFGVCAGVADYFGIKIWQARAAAVVLVVLFPPQTILVYILATIFIKKRPPRLYRNRDEEDFWRSVSVRPDQTFSGLRYKFRDLEQRLAGLERHVTSEEFKLNRAFRDIE